MGRLDGKVAVITGAASGIGRATAIKFAGEGAAVVIADLNDEGGEAAVRDCKENAGRAVFQKTDVSAEAEIKALIARAIKEFGRLDIIYNNAGIGGAVGSLEQISVEDWDKSQAVLLRGVFLGMKHAAPELRKAGGGSIISTASIAGIRGAAGLHAYCAAKAAVVNLTRSAALEFAKDKIRVNCICPGIINTPILHRNLPGYERSDGTMDGEGSADSARGPSGGYRRDGALPGQRRFGIRHRAGDDRGRRTDGRQPVLQREGS